jgi:hypothetical protein
LRFIKKTLWSEMWVNVKKVIRRLQCPNRKF